MPSIVKLTLESNQYERGIKNAQKQWDQFTKGIGLSVSKFTAVSAAVGAVTGALKVAKDAFFNNEQQLDEWGRTVEASKAVYGGFLSALNNGDIGGFLNKMEQIVSAARSAYDAMDELATYNAFNRMNVSNARAELSEAIADYRMGSGSKDAVKNANEELKKQLLERQKLERDAYEKSVREMALQRDANPDDVIKLLGGKYVDFKNVKASYKEESSFSAQTIKSLFGGATVAGAMSGVNFGTQLRQTPGTDAERLAVFARQLNDKELDQLQAMGEAANNTKREIADLDKQLTRVLNGKGGATTGGGSKSGATTGGGVSKSGGTTKQVKELTEMQSNQQRINELTQEYVNISNNATADVVERQKEIRNEIALLNQRNNQLKLYSEQAQGKLQGGDVQTEGLSRAGVTGVDLRQPTLLQGLDSETLAKMNSVGDAGNDAAKSWASAANAISGVGSALNSIEDPAAKVMGIVAQAIATVAAAHAQALETDWSSKSSIYAFIAAAAASTASMISMISAIHSATGYAQGGIVEGKSYSGDNIPAMLNAGEIVLSKSMQSTLAANLTSQDRGLNIVGELQGEKIVLVANRYFKRTGQGEIVTW